MRGIIWDRLRKSILRKERARDGRHTANIDGLAALVLRRSRECNRVRIATTLRI